METEVIEKEPSYAPPMMIGETTANPAEEIHPSEIQPKELTRAEIQERQRQEAAYKEYLDRSIKLLEKETRFLFLRKEKILLEDFLNEYMSNKTTNEDTK